MPQPVSDLARPKNASISYLGSKRRILPALVELIGEPDLPGAWFVDLFAGTGVVGAAAAHAGWNVLANDHLVCSTALSAGALATAEQVEFAALGGYEEAIRELNLVSCYGFISREYASPGESRSGHVRKYFTSGNASRIDGARALIGTWAAQGLITKTEELLLVADLLTAASQVSNTAGTYGAFLSKFSDRSRRELRLVSRDLGVHDSRCVVSNMDVMDVAVPAGSTVYLDPPYTKRQYAAYYHVLETIAVGDEPLVEGVTGLRPWRDKSSSFCFKRRATQSLADLIDALAPESRRVLLSYSEDGHADLEDLCALTKNWSNVLTREVGEIARYRPNKTSRQGEPSVRELIVQFE